MQLTGASSRAFSKGDPEPPLAPGTARIYSMRFCPWAERVVLYAAAKGIRAEVVNINLFNKPPWFLEKFPEGKAPAFEMDGKFLVESAVIIEFLDGVYPDSSILPSDPYRKARQRLKAEKMTAIPTAFYGIVAVMNDKTNNESLRKEKMAALEAAFDSAEKELHGEYFGGSSPGFADWVAFPFFERIFLVSLIFPVPSIQTEGYPGARWPRLSSWWTTMKSHPIVKAVTLPPKMHHDFFAVCQAGKPDVDTGL